MMPPFFPPMPFRVLPPQINDLHEQEELSLSATPAENLVKSTELPPRVPPPAAVPKPEPLRRPTVQAKPQKLWFPSVFDHMPIFDMVEKPADLAGDDRFKLFNFQPEVHHPASVQGKSPPEADPHKVGKRVLPEQMPLASPPTDKSVPQSLPPVKLSVPALSSLPLSTSGQPIKEKSSKPSILERMFGGFFDDDDEY